MYLPLRSGRKGPSALPADKWRGIVTSISTDNGVHWSWPTVHSLYAHVHSSLLTLDDGRIVLTYAVVHSKSSNATNVLCNALGPMRGTGTVVGHIRCHMTMALHARSQRLGELEGRLYHGHEAVISHDHGVSWDWGRRWVRESRAPHPPLIE